MYMSVGLYEHAIFFIPPNLLLYQFLLLLDCNGPVERLCIIFSVSIELKCTDFEMNAYLQILNFHLRKFK
jgi:hypothetical protein